jgi:hypothetical protein
MWVARHSDLDDPRIIEALEASRDEGCRNVDAIIAKYAKSYGLSDAAWTQVREGLELGATVSLVRPALSR